MPPNTVSGQPPDPTDDSNALPGLPRVYKAVDARKTDVRAFVAGQAGLASLAYTAARNPREFCDNVVWWAWRLSAHSREPTANEHQRLRRKVRSLLAGRTRKRRCSLDPGHGPGSFDSMMRFLDLLFANAGDPGMLERLKATPIGRRNEILARYGRKPWRTRASRSGNKKSLEGRTAKKAERAARAVELHIKGLSNAVIAARLGVSTKTVERALSGRRSRRRTRRRKCGRLFADICDQSELVQAPGIRSVSS